jgi:hypothetical protein
MDYAVKLFFDPKLRIVFQEWKPPMTYAQVLAAAQITVQDVIHSPCTLLDVSAVLGMESGMSMDCVNRMAHLPICQTRLAIVATTPAQIGMARMLEIRASLVNEGSQIAVFSSRREAIEWLRASTFKVRRAGE